MGVVKRRSIVPGALVVVGLAGLGSAAAAELGLTWDATFQGGAVEVQAGCQDGPIDVAFAEPRRDASAGLPWSIDAVEFSGISEKCHRMGYQAAYQTTEGGQWSILAPQSVEVGETVSVWLRDADSRQPIDPRDLHGVALTVQDLRG